MTKKGGLHFLFSDGSLRVWCWSQTLWILCMLWFALSLLVFELLVCESYKCIFFFYKIENFYSNLIYVYIHVKLPLGNLNPDPCPPHLTSIYTCGVITAPRVRAGVVFCFRTKEKETFLLIFYKVSYSFFIFVLKLILCRFLYTFFTVILCGMSHNDKNKNWWWFQSIITFKKKLYRCPTKDN